MMQNTVAAMVPLTKTALRLTSVFVGWLLVLVLTAPALAVSTNLSPVADTTLSEGYPGNNFGGMTFANSGTTQNFTRNRALFRFDLAGVVPGGSSITSARLILEVTGEPADGYAFADFGLHRLLVPWSEGTKTNASPSGAGQGSPASTNEATWFYRFAFTTNTWSAPGAAATSDYVAAPSAAVTVYGLNDSPYYFGSTAQTIADVQLWLDDPQTNFGWILVCQAETTDFTARRFGSRENANFPPQLEIEYLVAPVIDRVEKNGSQFSFQFTAQPSQSYTIEYRDALGAGGWQTSASAGPFTEPIRVLFVDTTLAPGRFYQVVTY